MHLRVLARCRIFLVVTFLYLLGSNHHIILHLPQMSNTPTNTTNAIVFYATQDSYACSVLVNIHLLHHVVKSKTRIIVMISDDISSDLVNAFNSRPVTVVREEPRAILIHPNSISYYKGFLLKLAAFRLHEIDESFQRLLVLDSDQLILRNPDDVFHTPNADLIATPASWLNGQAISSTCMLIQSNTEVWARVKGAMDTIKPGQYDMDLVNDLFPNLNETLSGSYGTLNSH